MQGTSPPLIQAILAFSAALLAPVIGAVIGLLSRTSLQRRQQEAEYNIKRLELIEKAIGVGTLLSNNLNIRMDISLAQSEYFRIIDSLSVQEPPSWHAILSFERHRLPMRLVFLPRPMSISGWVITFSYYMNALICAYIASLFAFVYGECWFTRSCHLNPDPFAVWTGNLIFLLFIIATAVARFWAIRVAKATIRRDREKFERQTASQHTPAM